MKLFIASYLTETNTWSPIPTGRNAFVVDKPFYRTDGSRAPASGANGGSVRVGGGNSSGLRVLVEVAIGSCG